MTAKSVAALLDRALSKAAETAAENIFDELTEATPVATGRTRASWKVGRGRAEPGHVAAGGSKASPLQAPAFPGVPEGQGPIIISNDAPIINRLNDGHSDQAPSNFIQGAVTRGANKTNR